MSIVERARKLRPYIVMAAQSLSDTDAVKAAELYEAWKPDAAYESGYKLRRNGKVYKVRQAHTAQAGWEPENVPALFEEINETHAGTLEDPIPYAGSMALEAGLYYSQNGVTYLCIRDSGAPMYHDLDALIDTYVKKA